MDKRFEEIAQRCTHIMNECGYELPPTTFTLNGRLSKTLGRCYRLGDGEFGIEISKNYAEGCIETGNIRQLEGTILHEMAHTLPFAFNHGKVWKIYTDIINDKFGYEIERMSSVPNEVREYTVKDGVYICCDKCNRRTLTGRNRKVVKIGRASCRERV